MASEPSLAEKIKKYSVGFFKWLLAGLIIVAVGGLVGALFHMSVEAVTELRLENEWLIWLLPLGGLVIAGLYTVSHVSLDTNIVIHAVQEREMISPLMAPLIFITSTVSHLFGASVGREGAALQIGGSIGCTYGRIARLDEADMHIVVMAGMSAVFAAVFGTPVTAVFFSLEVAAVGIMYYAGLLPCLTAALTASGIARAFGLSSFDFHLAAVPALDIASACQTAALGLGCAALGMLFCAALEGFAKSAGRLVKNPYLRIFAGGLLIALATAAVGTRDYNGAGTEIIYAAVAGSARPWAFVLKLIFTVICVGVGYKGGEIVPTLFIGACFGCTVGPLIGMDAGFAAALCMVGLFCAMVNCPIASIVLSIELFGAQALPLFAIVCVLSYMLSGSFSLYRQQRVVYSKVKATLFPGTKNKSSE